MERYGRDRDEDIVRLSSRSPRHFVFKAPAPIPAKWKAAACSMRHVFPWRLLHGAQHCSMLEACIAYLESFHALGVLSCGVLTSHLRCRCCVGIYVRGVGFGSSHDAAFINACLNIQFKPFQALSARNQDTDENTEGRTVQSAFRDYFT